MTEKQALRKAISQGAIAYEKQGENLYRVYRHLPDRIYPGWTVVFRSCLGQWCVGEWAACESIPTTAIEFGEVAHGERP